MSRSLKFATLFPEELNLNGDQANLIILAKRLSWQQVSVDIHPINNSRILDADLVFVGHGSVAAWNAIETKEPELFSILAELVNGGANVFAVASGAVRLAKALGIEVNEAEHRSEFVSYEQVIGYLNSSSSFEPVVRVKNSILTLLHGPVLAKNPVFADQICIEAGWITKAPEGDLKKEIDELARASRKIALEH